MTRGLPLDSHLLLWLAAEVKIRQQARFGVAAAMAGHLLYMSVISIWEIGVAVHRKSFERKPDLRGLSIETWFRTTTNVFGIQRLRVSSRIALEAAEVPAVSGYGDQGDCFLIATARIRNLSLVTRDDKVVELTERQPNYLSVIVC